MAYKRLAKNSNILSDQESENHVLIAIRFELAGLPVPKKRPRVTARGTYTPKQTVDYERSIAWSAKAAMGHRTPTENKCSVKLVFQGSKADLDNLAKSAIDGMNGIVYKDDRQVVRIDAEKTGGEPKTIVEVIEL